MHFVTRASMAVLGIVAAGLAFSVLREVRRTGRDSQTALEFNTRNAANDFRLLMAGNMVLLAGFVTFTIGAARSDHLIMDVGDGIILLFFLFPIAVLRRWRRRLR